VYSSWCTGPPWVERRALRTARKGEHGGMRLPMCELNRYEILRDVAEAYLANRGS